MRVVSGLRFFIALLKSLLVPGFSFLHINDSTAIERYILVL